jgi:arylsulfatase A
MVSQGLCLTQHYSAAPVCTPARAGFLTGRYPHRTGGLDMRESRGLDRIARRERTVGDCFKKIGYATGLIGKWHNGAFDPEYHPNARGFDEFVGFRHGLMYYYDWTLDRNGVRGKSDGRYLTDVLSDEAVDFIHRHRAQPFFLCLMYNAPHEPLEVPDDEVAPYRQTGRYHENVSKVYGMVTRMDKGIARVLEALKRDGLEENTLVCFTSDNGPAMYSDMDRFNCNYRGGKGHTYEGGIRVPMVLRWPAGLNAGQHFDSLVHFCDWLPTFLAAAGAQAPQELPIDGINVLPALQGQKDWLSPKRFWQWNRYMPVLESNAAMRDGPWKLVRPMLKEANWTNPAEMAIDRKLLKDPASLDRSWLAAPLPPRTLPPAAPWELYNIDQDPGEQNNLASQDSSRVLRMSRELETWFESVERDLMSIADQPEASWPRR